MPVNEREALAYFIYMVKMNKNKLDNKDANQAGTDEGKDHKLACDKKDWGPRNFVNYWKLISQVSLKSGTLFNYKRMPFYT